MAASTAAPGDEPLVREPGALGRLTGALFSPVPTFEAIARRPTWLAPVLALMLASGIASMALAPRLDFAAVTREAFEKRNRPVAEGQLETVSRVQRIFVVVAGFLAPGIFCLVVAGVLFLAFKAFGDEIRFAQAFAATAHANLPRVISSLLLIPVALSREAIDPRFIGDLLRSNAGFLVDQKSAPALHALLQSLDLFSLWALALLVVGFASASRTRRGHAAAIAVTIFVLSVLGRVGIAALFH